MIHIYNYFLLFFIYSFPKALLAGKYIDNVGTVLFFDSDNMKKCWNYDDVALLSSRKIFQDVLPSEDVIKINSDNVVHNLIEYFHLILEVVESKASGKSKHLMLLAVSDTFGGYINHFILPATKHSYYAGFLSYESVHKLLLLFGELKNFLKTNGASWAHPVNDWSMKRTLKVEQYRFNVDPNNTKACSNIIYYEAKVENGAGIVIPMPFFDSNEDPIAIAIPFKTFSLRNIESKKSAFVLVKYYVAAKRCIFSKPNKAQGFRVFNSQFRDWLEKEVMPRLRDDKFYAAFGGVLRLHKNVINEHTKHNASLEKIDEGVNVMPKIEKMYRNITKSHKVKVDSPDLEAVVRKLPEPIEDHSIHFFTLALIVALFIWALLGTFYICYQLCRGKNINFMSRNKPTKPVQTKSTAKPTSREKPSIISRPSNNEKSRKSSKIPCCLKSTTTNKDNTKPKTSRVQSSLTVHQKSSASSKLKATSVKKQKRQAGGRSYSTPRSGCQSSEGRNKNVFNSDKSDTSNPENQYNFDFSIDDSSSEETDFTSEEDLLAENHSR